MKPHKPAQIHSEEITITSDSVSLDGTLAIPEGAHGIVLFAHGSGSSRLSPRNRFVAEALQAAGIGTLLFDLLSEDEALDRENVFDVDFLGHRLLDATKWLRYAMRGQEIAVGYFGASTGAAAALIAAAQDPGVSAIVSRGGRPDLAMRCLDRVKAPTLLIVGGEDDVVIPLNEKAYARLRCEKALKIVPGATHLFEEPGTLDEVVRLAIGWFKEHLAVDDPPARRAAEEPEFFSDRAEAGRRLAARLVKFGSEHPVVIAIPRGGVPVGAEVARALNAPLDVVVVRKIGAPDQPELGIGALVDGDHPESVLNQELIGQLAVSRDYLVNESEKQLKEIHRRQRLYRGGRGRPDLKGRTVIVVDDGIATGGSVRAALRGLRNSHPKRLVLAVPIAPRETLEALAPETDEIVCLSSPEPFYAVGQFYRDFHQVSDNEVTRILEAAHPAQAPAD
ncbi:MAG TPA: phosphoribosyltransferase family protein [Candidatus Binataceae bacterium]|nr:phosphoribosyltransferase family protein [Candidatus Binataceae bacterium]